MPIPALIVHGGAGSWTGERKEESREGIRAATQMGWNTLSAGGSALDAVEKAVNILEDDPVFDAGFGSFLNQHGEVEMDALIVDGATVNFGSVAAVKTVQYPISLARRILEDTPQCMIVGQGADEIATSFGLVTRPNLTFATPEQIAEFQAKYPSVKEKSLGTVGAVAIDQDGNIASATSTGGTRNKPRGRVGDSPLFGAGGYADNRFGASSATGQGEFIMRALTSKFGVDQIGAGKTATEAAQAAIDYMMDLFEKPETGLIMVDKDGNLGAAHSTLAMPIGWVEGNGMLQIKTEGGLP